MGCQQSTVAEPPPQPRQPPPNGTQGGGGGGSASSNAQKQQYQQQQQQKQPPPSATASPATGVKTPAAAPSPHGGITPAPAPAAGAAAAAAGERRPSKIAESNNNNNNNNAGNRPSPTPSPSSAAAAAAGGGDKRRPSRPDIAQPASTAAAAKGPTPNRTPRSEPENGAGERGRDGGQRSRQRTPSPQGRGDNNNMPPPPADRQLNRKESLEESSFKDVGRVKHIDHSELTFIKVIGEGGFKTVWAGTWRGKSVAVGEFKDLDGTQNEEFTHELEMLKDLEHDNVVRLLGIVKKPPGGLFMVTEYVKRGSLFNMLHKEKVRLTLSIRWKIVLGIARGLWYLHSVGLAHRDMKSDNVLISTEWSAKLTDFGMAKKRSGDSGASTTMAHTMCGTALWMPPEIMSARQYHPFLADVYSCAMVLYEVVARKIPFANAKSEAELVRRVAQQKERPPFPDQDEFATPEVVALLQSMWDDDPVKRPRMGEVLSRLADLCPFKDHVLPDDTGAVAMTPKKNPPQDWPKDGVKLVRKQLPTSAAAPPTQVPAEQQQIRLTKEELQALRQAQQGK